MQHAGALAVVWALSLLSAVAGGLLGSVLITSVGGLAVTLALAAAVAVWTTDRAEETRSWMTTPDRVEK